MDLSFSQEQEMLRDSVSRYLEKNYNFDTRQSLVASDAPWSQEAWQQFAELGLLMLPFSEDSGGLGGSISDCVAFAQSFGQHLVIEPYVSAVMLAGMAMDASKKEAASRWVEKLATGAAVAAFAYEEGAGTPDPALIQMTAQTSDTGVTLTGEKRLVIGGAEADVLVIAARSGDTLGLYLVEKGAAGLSTADYVTIDGRSAANIHFAGVPATVLEENADEAIQNLLAQAIIVQSAEAVGAMKALLDLTTEYAMTRKQFGQPIGMFQSVAHRLADMKMAYSKALATLIYTTGLAESGATTTRDISVLKGQLGKLGRQIGEAAIQTHGGVGMTDELSVSHYHKRLLAYDAQLGDHAYHLRKIGAC